MKVGVRWLRSLLGVGLLLGFALVPAQARADDTTYSGQATVVKATVLGNTTTLADTGPLPASGGAQEAALLDASIPGTLTIEVLHAATVAQGSASRAEASVANLNVTVGKDAISADFLMARAAATCNQGNASVSGSSDIATLVINGQTISVTGQPNQKVTLPDGQVIINEQSSSVSGKDGTITVNALHIIVTGVADIVISSAHADIHCGATQPPCVGDFITGGGWITCSGAKCTFAVAGGLKNGKLWGHLEYIDHGTKLKVKGTGVTEYDVIDIKTRRIKGTCEINGAVGTYTVDVVDNGEPAKDTFGIQLFDSNHNRIYNVSPTTLGGGNLKLHGCD